jgi:predicted PurR-regulated permease PerM
MLDIREGGAPANAGGSPAPERGRVAVELPVRGGRVIVRPRVLHALSRPLWIVALCSLIALLRAAHAALVPIALALLVACVLSGVVEWLRRHHVPRGVGASVLLLAVALALGGVAELTWSPAQQWMRNAPKVLHAIERKVRPAQSLLRRLDYIAKRATALAESDGEAAASGSGTEGTFGTVAAATPTAAMVTPLELFTATGWALAGFVTVMGFALLLLIGGPPTLARLAVALAADLRAVRVLEVIDAIRLGVGRYYGTMLLINIGFGAVVAGAMDLLGMPNPVLWGVIAGVLNFIPVLGSAVTFTIVTVVALVTFNSITHVLLVCGSYLLIATVEGHVVEPLFFGKTLDLNPVVVLTALWLGGWLWGIPGVVLALPVVVAVRSVRRLSSRPHNPGGGRPLTEVYQRPGTSDHAREPEREIERREPPFASLELLVGEWRDQERLAVGRLGDNADA